MKIHKKLHKAFTLIELLIVIAIISILALIAVSNFTRAQTKARLAGTLSNFHQIVNANGMYMIEWGTYMPFMNVVKQSEEYFRFDEYVNRDLFIDKFFKDDNWKGVQPFDAVYDYCPGTKDGVTSFVLRTGSGKYNMFNLESVGPDGIDSAVASGAFGLKNSTYGRFIMFNLSNGIHSIGDIIKPQHGIPDRHKEIFNRGYGYTQIEIDIINKKM